MEIRTKFNWIVNGLLAVILVLLAGTYWNKHSSSIAMAAGGGWETDGVMVGTTKGDTERLILIDTVKQTMVLYRTRGNNGGLTLTGARSYQYDLEIVDSGKKGLGNNGATFLETLKLYFTERR